MRITKYNMLLDDSKCNMLVREKSVNYSRESNLDNPCKIAIMMNELFHVASLPEEHLYMVAMTAKSKPVGIFEISHGCSTASIVSPAAVFSRLLLCGAPGFAIVREEKDYE